jgi:hypothetical protein
MDELKNVVHGLEEVVESMVSLLPWMTLTAGVSVSQWADTTRMARDASMPAPAAGYHDLKKLRVGIASSMKSMGERCDGRACQGEHR